MSEKDPKFKKAVERAVPLAKKAGSTALRSGIKAARTARQKARAFDQKHVITEAAHERRKQAAEREYNSPEAIAEREARYERERAEKKERVRRAYEAINDRGNFNKAAYIQRRLNTDPWVAVEIGPRTWPTGLDRAYRGKSAYIGVDLHNPDQYDSSEENQRQSEEVFDKIKNERPGENIFLFSGSTRDLTWGIADELFAVYVYDDPETSWHEVTSEAYRILKPGGHFLVQDHARHLADPLKDHLVKHGFELRYAQQTEYFNFDFSQESEKEAFGQWKAENSRLGVQPLRSELDVLIVQKPLEPTT